MTTWATLKAQIGRKVNNPQMNRPEIIASALDNANDGLRLIATMHTGVASQVEIVGDGETAQFPIPTNCINSEHTGIYAIYDTDNEVYLRETTCIPGDEKEEGFNLWPSGYITFNPVPDEGNSLVVYYVAYYDELLDDSSVITLPPWAIEPLKLYTCGRVLEDAASKMALLGEFRTKVDSGTPESQPILTLSKHYIKEFWDILNSHPAPQYDRLHS